MLGSGTIRGPSRGRPGVESGESGAGSPGRFRRRGRGRSGVEFGVSIPDPRDLSGVESCSGSNSGSGSGIVAAIRDPSLTLRCSARLCAAPPAFLARGPRRPLLGGRPLRHAATRAPRGGGRGLGGAALLARRPGRRGAPERRSARGFRRGPGAARHLRATPNPIPGRHGNRHGRTTESAPTSAPTSTPNRSQSEPPPAELLVPPLDPGSTPNSTPSTAKRDPKSTPNPPV